MIGRALPPVKLASVFSLALLLASITVLNVRLHGQVILGSIVGTIRILPVAALRARRSVLPTPVLGNGIRVRPALGGDYQFLNLVPGIYRVDVEQSGFKRATREKVEVTVAGAVRADISMQVGDVTQTVEVQATAPLLQTENANLSQVVNSRSVEELPVNGRNI